MRNLNHMLPHDCPSMYMSESHACLTCLSVHLAWRLNQVMPLCSIHVASVVQMTHLLLQQAGIAKVMSPAQVFATYTSALIHDFEHLGVNNDYLIKSFHPLAVMYNDISPLENHHVAAAGRVMQRPECRFIKVCQTLSPEPVLAAYEVGSMEGEI